MRQEIESFSALTAAIWLLDATITILGARALGLQFSYPVARLLAGLGLGSALPSPPGFVGIYQFVAVTVPGCISKSAWWDRGAKGITPSLMKSRRDREEVTNSMAQQASGKVKTHRE